jgi:hypothetical protein
LANCSVANLVLQAPRQDKTVEETLTVLELIQQAGLRFDPNEHRIIQIFGDLDTQSSWIDVASPTQEVEDGGLYLIIPKNP